MEKFPSLNTAGKYIGKNWCEWKENFLYFLQKEDPTERYKKQWTIILLKLIDPFVNNHIRIKIQAYKYLSYENNPTKDLELLLRDLDVYFIFGTREKQREENIDKYVDELMVS